MLLVLPFIGFCGLFAAGKVMSGRGAKAQKALGEQFVSKLEGERAEHGKLPEDAKPPEQFTYRPEGDGGYVLYFAEPAFMLPSDFFYVWDRGERRWRLTEASELPR